MRTPVRENGFNKVAKQLPHFSMGVLIFSEELFIRTTMEDCFCLHKYVISVVDMAKYFFSMVFFMKAWPKHVKYYELDKKK